MKLFYTVLVCLLGFISLKAQQKDELSLLLDSLLQVQENSTTRVDVLNQIAWEYRNINPRMGITYAKQALELAKELKYEKGIGKSLSFMGVNYKNLGEHSEALKFFMDCSSHSQKIGNVEAEGHSYNNIGEIYRLQKRYEQAEKNFYKALNAGKNINNSVLIAYAHNSFGKLYKDLKEYDKALVEHQKALEIRKKIQDKKAIAASIENISKVYEAQNKMDEAVKFYYQAFESAKEFNDSRGMSTALIGIARIHLHLQKYAEAREAALESLKTIEKVGDKVYQKDAYEVLVKIAKATQSYQEALAYQDQYLVLQDSIFNDKIEKDINYLTKAFQEEQDRSHMALLKEQQKTIYAVIILVSLGLIISTIFSIFLLRSNRNLNQTQEELRNSMDIIAKKSEDIEASIRYASRIQTALLPNAQDFTISLPQHFVFYRPLNVVGGDFYFFREINHKVFLAVADCTGHGVPGALLSIVGSMALQKVIVDLQVQEADKILALVHQEMRRTLKQSQENNGMEIALCVIDRSLGSLEIASAKNPVYVFQNENLTVIEGDRVMIGDTKLEEAVFQKYIFSLENVTQIYLASDGLQDQFSSHTNKKLTKRGLRGLLQQIHHKPIQQQAKELETHLLNWQGSESQTDDILVLGVQMQPSNKALSSAM